jgi:tetratricopeptide (TPR) repeat protein
MTHIIRFCKISLVLLLVFFFSEKSQAQKLKYKNIYALLESEQYEAALPDLTIFLNENPKHGSATIYMGVVAQEYEKDCAKANTSFSKALEIIDQKELDKNKNYYGLWYRRNLRTGKYGVILDNVRLDLDARMKDCED